MKVAPGIASLYRSKPFVVSLEFFPPRQEEGMNATKELIRTFTDLHIDFMTVTYGAGGSTQSLTAELVSYVKSELGQRAVAHLTCVGHAKRQIDQIVSEFVKAGINDILALRGDPPKGSDSFVPPKDGFSCARDLIAHLNGNHQVSVLCAGYPETHRDAKSPDADIKYLREKVEAGAEVILTQLFFDVDFYQRFVERAQKEGITVPIVPGIMPVRNVSQVERFTAMCGATIPAALMKKLDELRDDKEALKDFGAQYALEMCLKLKQAGAPGVHLYTLNHSTQVRRVISQMPCPPKK